jgi:hypothetical protein
MKLFVVVPDSENRVQNKLLILTVNSQYNSLLSFLVISVLSMDPQPHFRLLTPKSIAFW